jgi:hydrophobic/amphiphilic exporter-1 (mainly G- bacteria), HAE1 family
VAWPNGSWRETLLSPCSQNIVARVSPKLFGIPGAIVVAFEPPAINGMGSFGEFQFQLQDLGRNTLEDLDNVSHKIVVASRQRPDLTGLFTSYTATDPQQSSSCDCLGGDQGEDPNRNRV